MDVIERLKEVLVPQGSLPLVRLFLNKSSYFDEKFINECIREMQRLPIKVAMGEEISPLQRLGMAVLTDSAYIDTNKE